MKDSSKTKKELIEELRLLRSCAEGDERASGCINIEHCHALLGNITDLAYICDDKGNIIYLNNAFEEMTGHKPEKFIGKSFKPLFDTKNLKIAVDGYQRTLKGESPSFEVRFKEAAILCAYKNIPYRNKDGKIIGVMGTARDITAEKKTKEKIKCAYNDLEICIQERTDELSIEIEERKKTEEALIKTDERLKKAQEIAHVGTWDWDPNSGALIWTDEIFTILGYSPNEVEPSYELFLDRVHPDDREELETAVTAALEDKKSYNIDCRIVRKDGSTVNANVQGDVHFDEDGKPIRMLGLLQDITDRKLASKALEESEKFLSIAQEIAHLGHWKLDPVTNEVTGSAELYRIFGIEKEGSTFESFIEMVHPEDREFDISAIQRGLEKGEDWDIEHRLVMKDGTEKHVHAVGHVIKNETGKVLELIGTVQDITTRKKTEDALKEAKETYESMFLNSMVGMARTRISDGKFLNINDRLLKMFGYDDREEFLNNTNVLKHYANPAERERLIERIKESGEAENFEMLAKKKDGSTFLIQFSARINKEGGYIDTVSVDIDDQRRAEEALKDATNTYESMFLNSKVGMSRTRLSDGEFLAVNDRLVKMFGYDDNADFVANYSAIKCYAIPGERERALSLMKEFGEINNFETLAKRKDGSTFWVQYTGRVDKEGGYLDAVSVDVTERMKVESSLKKSEEKYRMLVDNMNVGFGIINKEGIITFANNALCTMFGYPQEEIIGSPIASLLDEANEKILLEQISKRKDGVKDPYELEFTRKDGSKITTFMSPVPNLDEDGHFKGSFAVITDITERKRLSERIEALNRSFLGFGTDSVQNISSLTHLLGSLMEGTYALYNRIDHGILSIIAGWNTPADYNPVDKPKGHICYDVIRNKGDDIFFIGDLTQTDYARTDKNVVKYNLKSYMGKAITCSGKHIGSLCVVFTDEFTPSVEDKRYLEIIAVAIGIEEERKLAGEKLAISRENSRSLSLHLQNMQEQERGRIARDIHDDLGQLLTALDFDLAYVTKRLRADQSKLKEKTQKMSELIRVSTETVQRIASELRPALLDNLGLMAAMEWQADEYSAHTGINCEVKFEPSIKVNNKNLSTALFRAFQEALTNAARHANPSNVLVSVKVDAKRLTLEITDDGKGIKEEDVLNRNSFGLSGIMERFHPFGGNVKIKGVKDKGTTISIAVPFGEEL